MVQVSIKIMALQHNILEAYRQFEAVVKKSYTAEEDLSIIGCPSQEQLTVLVALESIAAHESH